ncbi:MAG: LysM peptidoglycan-binding domain-containing protein [Lachnospiraceae bacterium]|nr:LysM peptidoglycan-binding domain-containing protein [Lachnospiraceae bacterium]
MKKRNSKHHSIFNLFTVFVLTAAIICSIGFVVSAKSNKSSYDADSYYQSIRIEAGDTLWTIAEEYCPSSHDIHDYIETVKSINDIKNNTIKAGDYIIVTVYK